jgi:hypothetical protein
MKWVTPERPKIDCIACPWPIKNFVNQQAEFIYVTKEEVFEKACIAGLNMHRRKNIYGKTND